MSGQSTGQSANISAKQALNGGRKATEVTDMATSEKKILSKAAGSSSTGTSASSVMTRTEAEAKYSKLLDSLLSAMETLETAVQAAPNTKLDIKTAVKSMGVNIRDFTGLAKKLGMARNPDATELRVKQLQLQQAQQHSETLKLLGEIKAEQALLHEAGLVVNPVLQNPCKRTLRRK